MTTTATPTKAKKINDLNVGESVLLHFAGSKRFGNDPYDAEYTFLGFEGEGDDRRAMFDGMEAYKFNGRWAYGSSAEKLSIAK